MGAFRNGFRIKLTFPESRTARDVGRKPAVNLIATWATGLVLASVLSGCCCCGGGCAGSPVPYSDGNPYECGSGNFWGVGYYCRQYGFLRRRDTCSCCIPVPAGYYDPAAEQNPAREPNPGATVPPAPEFYDSNPDSPSVPPPAP